MGAEIFTVVKTLERSPFQCKFFSPADLFAT